MVDILRLVFDPLVCLLKKIKAPLFIAQGRNDPRVPVTEALQMKAKVEANNGADKVWYMQAEDDGLRRETNLGQNGDPVEQL